MLLKQIKLYNFRQFHGEQTLDCAQDKVKNVTLIHAENGIGKTTILNAIMCAFYGTTTPRFERKHEIINHEAVAEEKNRAKAKVSISFIENKVDYLVQRSWLAGSKDSKPSVYRIEGGVQRILDAPETFINSVLPNGMARYFFFDGEHAETFATENNQSTVKQAIRSMLGCTVAETVIKDLNSIGREFDQQIGNLNGEEEMRRIGKQIEDIQNRDDKHAIRLNEIEEQLSLLNAQREKIILKLRETAAAREIQQKKEETDRAVKETALKLKSAEKEIIEWIGVDAKFIVARKLAKETLAFIDDASLKGKIPSPYNEEFVKGLLDAQTCICCRPLVPSSSEYASVMSMLKTATNGEITDRLVRVRARIQQMREKTSTTTQLFMAQTKVVSRQQHLIDLEQKSGELSQKLQGIQIDEIDERERARIGKDSQISRLNEEKGSIKLQMSDCAKKIENLRLELDKLINKNIHAKKIRVRSKLAFDAKKKLEELLLSYEGDSRKIIEKKINIFLEEAARREYRFKFGDNYSMELFNDRDLPVARSGGENQLISLAFTSALVWYAELRSTAQGRILTPGTVAPLVLDSPFGQLDVKYRESTARFVPKMASQVILMVSSSQGNDTVLKALEPHVGAEYLLISENRASGRNKPDDRVALHGREYFASLYDQARDMTRIERIA